MARSKTPPPDPTIWIDLDAIRIWPGNYNEGDVGAITEMIRRFGFNRAPSLWREWECRAGNHSVLALREIKKTGKIYEWETFPPKHILEQGKKWFIRWIDVSYLNPLEATAYAIADNNAARLASTNDELLYKYLMEISEADPELFETTAYDTDQLSAMLEGFTGDILSGGNVEDDSTDPDPSDGSLLKLVKVAIADPRYKVEHGEVYLLGGKHVLCCCNLLLEWGIWAAYLKGDAIFCPLPGPYAALGNVAEERPLVMVQPDPYIAGHILEQYENLKGAGSVQKHT